MVACIGSHAGVLQSPPASSASSRIVGRLTGPACHRSFATPRPAEPGHYGSRRRESPPAFGGLVKKELEYLILRWKAQNCLPVRRSITGRRTGRQRDDRQSPADLARVVAGD